MAQTFLSVVFLQARMPAPHFLFCFIGRNLGYEIDTLNPLNGSHDINLSQKPAVVAGIKYTFRFVGESWGSPTHFNNPYPGGRNSISDVNYSYDLKFQTYVERYSSEGLSVDGSLKVNGGTAFNKVQAGSIMVGQNSGGVKSFQLNFPSSFFSAVPNIVATAKSVGGFNDIFVVTTRNSTSSSCVLLIYRVDCSGCGWGQDVVVDWIAWEQ